MESLFIVIIMTVACLSILIIHLISNYEKFEQLLYYSWFQNKISFLELSYIYVGNFLVSELTYPEQLPKW